MMLEIAQAATANPEILSISLCLESGLAGGSKLVFTWLCLESGAFGLGLGSLRAFVEKSLSDDILPP